MQQYKVPPVTKEDIESQIEQHFFFTLHGAAKSAGVHQLPPNSGLDRADGCVIILKNGFKVEAVNYCINKEGYSREYGQKAAYEAAFNKLWPIFGYERMTLAA